MNKFAAILLIIIFFSTKMIAQNYSIKINENTPAQSFQKEMLLGTNIGLFYEESSLLNFEMVKKLHELNPGIIRMPGGTWSNEIYWNGNGVRLSEESYIEAGVWDSTIKAGGNPLLVAFDTTRYRNRRWEVDYSGYAPGFRIADTAHHLSDYPGHTDVLFLHKFIQSFGCQTMVTVNMGTGTPEMAAQWVKWTKQRQNYALQAFDVKYWELGNELDGDWELGHFLPDGSEMDAKEYVRRYKIFTKAMKEADPTIKVGGSVASSMELAFIEELIKDRDCPIDFISFHAYPSNDNDTDFVKMVEQAEKINDAVARIKSWLKQYRPEDVDRVEIAVTEWNIKVREDITTLDMRNALWSAAMIGEMAKAGVDIAIQWDLFSTTPTGGHGLFNPKDQQMTPRSQYWAMYMWGHYMLDKIYSVESNTPDFVKSYVTKNDTCTAIMLINGSEKEVEIALDENIIKRKTDAVQLRFSKAKYRLDKETLIPVKSKKPAKEVIPLKKGSKIKLKPESITVVRFRS